MKISILIPTKDRKPYLVYALASIFRQRDSDWEVIISDNSVSNDVFDYIQTLSDPRIIYYRTDKPLSVTDNWNRALSMAKGEYIVMLGDDDCLLTNYLSEMKDLIRSWSHPDAIFYDAWQFHYPGVYLQDPQGFLMRPYHQFFENKKRETRKISKKEAREVVQAAAEIKLRYNFNMQYVLIAKRFLNDFENRYGSFFKSPYPDYFAMNALFITAQSIVLYPKKSVLIGVTPKSFGFYYANEKEKEGTGFLGSLENDPVFVSHQNEILPGKDLYTCWYVSMLYIEKLFGHLGYVASHGRYALAQMLSILQEDVTITDSTKKLFPIWFRWVLCLRKKHQKTRRFFKFIASRLIYRVGIFPRYNPSKTSCPDCQNALEIIYKIDRQEIPLG